MIADPKREKQWEQLDELAMTYEVAVIPFCEENYLKEFFDFYRIRNRSTKLVETEEGFDESLRDVSGEYRWEEIARKARDLFGLPRRILFFDEDSRLRDELGGRRGLSPFFFVFGMMFCEYEGFTLCFMSGTNN